MNTTEITRIKPVNYGTFEIIIKYRTGKEYSATTHDTQAIDDYRGDINNRKDYIQHRPARKVLINIVKKANNLK